MGEDVKGSVGYGFGRASTASLRARLNAKRYKSWQQVRTNSSNSESFTHAEDAVLSVGCQILNSHGLAHVKFVGGDMNRPPKDQWKMAELAAADSDLAKCLHVIGVHYLYGASPTAVTNLRAGDGRGRIALLADGGQPEELSGMDADPGSAKALNKVPVWTEPNVIRRFFAG